MLQDNIILEIVLVSALTIMVLRALPFTAKVYFQHNAYFLHLEQRMPLGVTLLLVAYTFKDVSLLVPPYGFPMFSATLLLLLVYALTGRTVLSIFVSLGWHIWLVNFIFS